MRVLDEDTPRMIPAGDARPVDLWVVDDVAVVEAASRATRVTTESAQIDVPALGPRRLNPRKMCAVIPTVDWRLVERWRWGREADTVVEVDVDEKGRAYLGGVADPIRLPSR